MMKYGTCPNSQTGKIGDFAALNVENDAQLWILASQAMIYWWPWPDVSI